MPRQFATLTIRITHPTMTLDAVSKVMGRRQQRGWDAGARRMSPSGKYLEGNNDSTYWGIDVGGKSDSIAELIDAALVIIEGAGAEYRKMLNSGGRTELFVGIFVDKNFGHELAVGLLKRLADWGVELGLDIYGPDGAEIADR